MIRLDLKAFNRGVDRILGRIAPATWIVEKRNLLSIIQRETQRNQITDDMVKRATLALLGKRENFAPEVDWKANREFTISQWEERMRAALHAALDR